VTGPDIFISYSREERQAARHFAECFAQEGFAVWWDAALRSGETFDEVIERELRAARAVVVLWSPRSVASRWVRAEATLADRANKLVPVIIESCSLPIIFELTQAADLANWTGDTADTRWKTLVSDLRRLVDPHREDSPAHPAAAAPTVKPASSSPAVSSAQPVKAPTSPPDELMKSLERLGKAREPELAKPTAAEIEQAEFFKRSDEFRETEGDNVHYLRRLDGEDEETNFIVTPSGLKVGRKAPADIVVPGAGVSREHCLIELAADQLRVTDLNSTNGTFIDNKRVDRSQVLDVGSVLRVGNVSFEHEVRTRAEMQQHRAANFDDVARQREGRMAGRS
jgi:TIR domain/FHA domain